MLIDFNFEIPPGAANHPGYTWATLNEAATLVYSQPHLHMRGKDMEIKLTYPTGESRTLVSVPRYSYVWQTIYVQEEAIQLPKGTRIDVYAHWDNSPNNPHGADPTKTVRWGDQSWDEMLVAFVGVIVDPKTDAKKLNHDAAAGRPARLRRFLYAYWCYWCKRPTCHGRGATSFDAILGL